MASLAKGCVLVKNLTPEQVGKYVAEGVLRAGGIEYDGRVRVRTEYRFNKGSMMFDGARVEIEVADRKL